MKVLFNELLATSGWGLQIWQQQLMGHAAKAWCYATNDTVELTLAV
jgi:hypothetical protein